MAGFIQDTASFIAVMACLAGVGLMLLGIAS
jgi:hypothetical protein